MAHRLSLEKLECGSSIPRLGDEGSRTDGKLWAVARLQRDGIEKAQGKVMLVALFLMITGMALRIAVDPSYGIIFIILGFLLISTVSLNMDIFFDSRPKIAMVLWLTTLFQSIQGGFKFGDEGSALWPSIGVAIFGLLLQVIHFFDHQKGDSDASYDPTSGRDEVHRAARGASVHRLTMNETKVEPASITLLLLMWGILDTGGTSHAYFETNLHVNHSTDNNFDHSGNNLARGIAYAATSVAISLVLLICMVMRRRSSQLFVDAIGVWGYGIASIAIASGIVPINPNGSERWASITAGICLLIIIPLVRRYSLLDHGAKLNIAEALRIFYAPQMEPGNYLTDGKQRFSSITVDQTRCYLQPRKASSLDSTRKGVRSNCRRSILVLFDSVFGLPGRKNNVFSHEFSSLLSLVFQARTLAPPTATENADCQTDSRERSPLVNKKWNQLRSDPGFTSTDFFVVSATTVNLPLTLGMFAREFESNYGRVPSFWIFDNQTEEREEILQCLPVFAAGCNQALVLLSEDTLCQPLPMLELMAAIATHGCLNQIQVISCGAYGSIFSTSLTKALEDFDPSSLAARIIDENDDEHGHALPSREDAMLQRLLRSHTGASTLKQSVLMLTYIIEQCRQFTRKDMNKFDFSGMLHLLSVQPYALNTSGLRVDSNSNLGVPSSTDQPDISTKFKIPLEIPQTSLKLFERIGRGRFGQVHKALYTPSNHEGQTAVVEHEVAVKVLNNIVEEDFDGEGDLLAEAMQNAQLVHPNVVRLVGVVTIGHPWMLVLQLCSKGCLKEVLKAENLDVAQIITTCGGVAEGMQYLALRKVVHRDLAARNVLMDGGYTPKIADFGMSQTLTADTDYYISQDTTEALPVLWCSPEVISSCKFSEASDVWAFGILCMEGLTRGADPYDGWSNNKAARKVTEGYIPPAPKLCPRSFFNSIIKPCLGFEAEDRPRFSHLCLQFRNQVSQKGSSKWVVDQVSVKVEDDPEEVHQPQNSTNANISNSPQTVEYPEEAKNRGRTGTGVTNEGVQMNTPLRDQTEHERVDEDEDLIRVRPKSRGADNHLLSPTSQLNPEYERLMSPNSRMSPLDVRRKHYQPIARPPSNSFPRGTVVSLTGHKHQPLDGIHDVDEDNNDDDDNTRFGFDAAPRKEHRTRYSSVKYGETTRGRWFRSPSNGLNNKSDGDMSSNNTSKKNTKRKKKNKKTYTSKNNGADEDDDDGTLISIWGAKHFSASPLPPKVWGGIADGTVEIEGIRLTGLEYRMLTSIRNDDDRVDFFHAITTLRELEPDIEGFAKPVTIDDVALTEIEAKYIRSLPADDRADYLEEAKNRGRTGTGMPNEGVQMNTPLQDQTENERVDEDEDLIRVRPKSRGADNHLLSPTSQLNPEYERPNSRLVPLDVRMKLYQPIARTPSNSFPRVTIVSLNGHKHQPPDGIHDVDEDNNDDDDDNTRFGFDASDHDSSDSDGDDRDIKSNEIAYQSAKSQSPVMQKR